MEGDTLTTWGYGAVNTDGAGYEAFGDPLTTWGYGAVSHQITEVFALDIIFKVIGRPRTFKVIGRPRTFIV